jgi:hypothetical protein
MSTSDAITVQQTANFTVNVKGTVLELSLNELLELQTQIAAALSPTHKLTPLHPLGPVGPSGWPWSVPMYPNCGDWTVRPGDMPTYTTSVAGNTNG